MGQHVTMVHVRNTVVCVITELRDESNISHTLFLEQGRIYVKTWDEIKQFR